MELDPPQIPFSGPTLCPYAHLVRENLSYYAASPPPTIVVVVVVIVPGPSVSGLSGLPVLFYQRTNHLFCCVNQNAESRLHDEVYETCNQRNGQIEERRQTQTTSVPNI